MLLFWFSLYKFPSRLAPFLWQTIYSCVGKCKHLFVCFPFRTQGFDWVEKGEHEWSVLAGLVSHVNLLAFWEMFFNLSSLILLQAWKEITFLVCSVWKTKLLQEPQSIGAGWAIAPLIILLDFFAFKKYF